MEYNKHAILQHINNPMKILFWEIPEAMSFLVPFTLLGLSSYVGAGFIIGTIAFFIFRKVKGNFSSTMSQVMYWYLPSTKKNYQCHVKSYVLEWFV